MVHISDGVLSPPVLAFGWLVTIAMITLALKKSSAEEIPKLSLITSAFFVASLFHIPVGPTSVHLILNGLVGITLGILAYPSIFIGLVLQAFLFGHGGITALGVNAMNMGLPAIVAYGVFKLGKKTNIKHKESIFGALAAGTSVTLAVLLTALMLLTTGREFKGVIIALVGFHVPVIVIEAIVTGAIVSLIVKVKPEVLK